MLKRVLVATAVFAAVLEVGGVGVAAVGIFVLDHVDPKWGDAWGNLQLAVSLLQLLVLGGTLAFVALVLCAGRQFSRLSFGNAALVGVLAGCLTVLIDVSPVPPGVTVLVPIDLRPILLAIVPALVSAGLAVWLVARRKHGGHVA